MLELRELLLRRPGGWALAADHLRVPPGRAIALVGPNGSGKTTLLRVLAGVLRPTAGCVVYGGRPVSGRRAERVLRREVVLVHQHPYLFDGTVADNLLYGLRVRGLRGRAARSACREAAERMGVAHLLHRAARTLSGGETQRVAIARALVLKPRVLLLDEPTSASDPQSTERVRDLIEARDWRPDASVVFTTHSPERLIARADAAWAIWRGRVLPLTEGGPAAAPGPGAATSVLH